jgi:NodT family efflux transporter outer membrane factor (OMF) lipoprotein
MVWWKNAPVVRSEALGCWGTALSTRRNRSNEDNRRLRVAGPALVGCILLLGFLSGCSVGRDYVPPQPDVPDAWHQGLTVGLDDGTANLHTWWSTFDDPVLARLIDRAVAGNRTVKIALARVAEARAGARLARGEWFPDVDGTAVGQRARTSGDFPPPTESRTDNVYSTGIDASWEIDLWGRIRRSVESANAGYDASVEDYRDALVVLFADVASTYIDVRALQARIRYALENVETQRGTVSLTADRNKAGLVGKLDVRQAQLNLASTESFIPTLRILLVQSIDRLAVLLGEHAGPLYEEFEAVAPIPSAQPAVTIAVPAELLRQRPDIRRAERELAAQTAKIGVATGDLYPRLSLSGSFAFEGTSDILEYGKRAWSFGPAIRWNLFDGGRVRARIKIEDARTEQALAAYEQTILVAFQDLEDGLVAYTQERIRRDALARSVIAAAYSVELVDTLYRTGLTDFQNVLDTQRSLFVQQDNLAESEGRVTTNLIRIYKALGGGWAKEPSGATSIDGISERLSGDS